MSERVIYLVRSWPRLSQTFIVGEVLALERRGVDLVVLSLVRSGEAVVQPQVGQVRADVAYLEDAAGRPLPLRVRRHLGVLAAAPLRYLATALHALRSPGLAAGYGTCTTWECFDHAVEVAATARRIQAAGDRVVHLHAHFAHDPALVGLLASRLTGLRYSFTGHARDLLQIPASSLAARAARACAVITCCEANAAYIAGAVPPSLRPPVQVIHHGVELDRFRPAAGQVGAGVPTITSVGRLVEKKGFEDLLRALAVLKETRDGAFRCRIFGDGPLAAALTALRDRLGLHEEVEFLGARDTAEVANALTGSDVFALTPRQTDDGDRDGIPNVLVEAMACAVPVVTTAVGGIPELVHDDVNGLLAPSADPAAVAARLARLLDDPVLRRRVGAAARETVERDYDVDAAARRLAELFLPLRHHRAEVPA